MAQSGFPKNPNVGDTFVKSGKTYIFQGDKWVIKDDFSGPNPGTKDGQEWTNVRTGQTYEWSTKTKSWSPKGSSTSTSTSTSSTSTTQPKTTTTTVKPSTKSTPSTTVAPTTTTTVPETVPNDKASTITKDYQAEYTESQNNAYGYLSSISSKQRKEFLNLLYSKGFGGSTKPTNGGLEPSDIEIATQFYVYYKGNIKSTENPSGTYKTVNDAYNDIKKWKTTVSTTGSGSFTQKMDVSSAFQQVMQNTLGRAPTEKEKDVFFKAYRSLESGGDAPNIQSAAESQIQTTMSAESEASAFSSYADVFEQLMRGA